MVPITGFLLLDQETNLVSLPDGKRIFYLLSDAAVNEDLSPEVEIIRT